MLRSTSDFHDLRRKTIFSKAKEKLPKIGRCRVFDTIFFWEPCFLRFFGVICTPLTQISSFYIFGAPT